MAGAESTSLCGGGGVGEEAALYREGAIPHLRESVVGNGERGVIICNRLCRRVDSGGDSCYVRRPIVPIVY